MTTIIVSSTNLLVNSALIEMGETRFGFFDFTLLGTVMAAVGLVYVVFVAPKLLPDRSGEVEGLGDSSGRQFIAHMTVKKNSPLIDKIARVDDFLVYQIKYYEWLSVTTRQFFHHSKIIRHKFLMCWWFLRREKLWPKP
jgi:di/tricarboxylate transporter